MQSNKTTPIILLFFILGSINCLGQNIEQRNVVKFSGAYVTFGTWDILGYGVAASFQRSLVKRPRLGLGDLQIGGELFVETGSKGTQMTGDTYSEVYQNYATNTTTSLWIKTSYYPIHKLIKGFNIALGPTIGYKNEVSGSSLNIKYNIITQKWRKEILDFKHVNSTYLGYRLSFGYDVGIKNKIIGLRMDFNSNTFGDVNLFAGMSLGIKL